MIEVDTESFFAIVVAVAATGIIRALERTFESSSPQAVRIAALLLFGLVLLAGKLGLDVLLSGFVAGMIARAAPKGHELAALGSLGAILKLLMFLLLRDRAAAGGGDHDDRRRHRPMETSTRRRPGRSGDARPRSTRSSAWRSASPAAQALS